jgi:hypothetical protein
VTVISVAGVAVAADGGGSDLLTLCAKKRGGALRLPANERCKADERRVLVTRTGTVIPGPPGVTGAAGPAGFAGATGAEGAAGAAGPQGEPGPPGGGTGPQGPTGAAGAAGATGPTGPPGVQGPIGGTGATGPAGAQGPTGPAGTQGPTGSTGGKGATGATGGTGATGAAGATGPTGQRGPTGPAGAGGPEPAQFVTSVAALPPASRPDCETNVGVFCSFTDFYWTNFGNGYGPVGYQRDGGGYVHLLGVARQQAGVEGLARKEVFFLPPGFRPANTMRFAAVRCGGDPTYVDVQPSGAVEVQFEAPYCTSLDGIVFHP